MAVARIARRADPRSDPRYKRVVSKLEADTRKLKQHPPPSRKSDESAKAAKGPANEKAAGARAKQVDKLEQSDTPKPQTASFLSMLRAEIEKVMPKTLGDTEKFMKGGSGNDIKSSLKGEVGNQKQAATGDLKQNSSAAPSEAGVAAKPVTPIPPEPGTPAPQIDAAAAMPAPKPAAEISLQDSKTEVADAKKSTKQTETRLTNAKDPRFSAVMSAEKAVHKQADAGPVQYRGSEAATLGKAGAQAKGVAGKGVSSLLATKGGSKVKVASKQEQQKAREELELSKFTNFVVTTFNTAKAAVDKRLETLDTTVNTMFDQGTDAALNSMKGYVEDALFKYKLERYLLMPGGSLLWIKDQILDLPPEVNRFYEAGRKLFTSAMDALAVKVANLVERELAAAKNDVALAQGKIAAAQAALSPAVRARGAQLTAEYADKFGELKSGIEDKKQQLAEGLAQKYKEAFDKADEALKAIQDANKGLVTQAKEKIAEVAKALMEFKDKLMGILRKGQDTIDLILDNPGGFLSNLIAAVKGGFAAFAGRIWDHLKKGFMKWLFGALASAGIEIPGDLSLVSILKLVLGVLGITYDRMRAKAVKLLGPTAVTVIEKLVGYLQTLIGGGPAALWEQVKGDLSSLKDMVIGAIQDWIVTTIVQKAVAKVVSMFNPAGAIIQAIMMIINVVMFVIERAAQIMEFVESVINSIHAIATGSIGGAISKVEQALGNAVPILIGFLAALIGLGGISAKIKGFITKVQAKVDQAIDKVIKKAVAYIKKFLGAIKAGVMKVLNWWKKKKPVSGGGEQHTLTFEGSGGGARLVLRSTPEKPSTFLDRAADARSVTAAKRKGPIGTTKTHEKAIASLQKQLAVFDDNNKAAAAGKSANEADKLMGDLDSKLDTMSTHISGTLTSWGAKDEPIKKFSLPRSTFTVEHKRKVAAQHTKKTDLRRNADKEMINLRKGLARRHIVSSFDMSAHYASFLVGKKWSEGKMLLEQRASIGEARTPVNSPLNQAAIVDAASRRYGNFFGYTKNLFIGNSRENSAIQQHLDAGHPDMAETQLRNHVRRIKRSWAIDPSMNISEL
ncbi:hypothetical protein LC55x_2589 [Lysobacter capsici]|uniref:hypothetical protein n=1 Tax=Lysobacter capsici TaxID=435897 RepID=UPI00071676CE|nr:hypothetical protein [Lysobacter capsici]ALN85854.1 hypothetical protein LC55x_2589 [Lysobacter capsici]